ncbi:hypothetical protein V8D89_006478 [Ganoderma adspersum]
MCSQTTARQVLRSLSNRSPGLTLTEGLEEAVSGFQQKTAWFLNNIVTGRPNLKARVRGQSRPRRRLRKSRKNTMPELEVNITTEEVSTVCIYAASRHKSGTWKSALHDEDLASVPTSNYGRAFPHRALRSTGMIQRSVTGELFITHGKVYDDEQSDYEDFGERLPSSPLFRTSAHPGAC